jgi:hypothetical protein
MDYYLPSYDIVICKFDCNVYMLKTTYSLTILVLCVDDILINGSYGSPIVVVKYIFHDRLCMMDMGPLHLFLDLEIS